MDTRELAPRYFQIAWQFGAAGQGERVVFGEQRIDADIDADLDGGAEFDTLRAHLLDAAVDQSFLHLEIGDAVAQQATDAIGLLEQAHGMPGARQLLGAGHAGRPGPDDRDALAGAARRRRGLNPALLPERDAATHAARGMGAQGRFRKRFRKLLPALFARRGLLIAAIGALDLEKPGRLTHRFP